MRADLIYFLSIIGAFLPFVLFVFLSGRANIKQEHRHKQVLMPAVALIYSLIAFVLLLIFSQRILGLVEGLAVYAENMLKQEALSEFIRNTVLTYAATVILVIFNTVAIIAYVMIKRVITLILRRINIPEDSFLGRISGLVYEYDYDTQIWFVRDSVGHMRIFFKAAYYTTIVLSLLCMFISCMLCKKGILVSPFYPIFGIILIGEIYFFVSGLKKEEYKGELKVSTDASKHIANYSRLREPLRALFGDKLSSEGTSVNYGGISGGSVEEVLKNIEETGDHIGYNYSSYIRKKMESGLKPSVNYVRSGYDLAIGRSLLFNTPFYYKLSPYVFYAMNRTLLTWGKVLVVLGRHGTEDDLQRWCEDGMRQLSNVPGLWKIHKLDGEKCEEDNLPDIGIISHSGVHDMAIHKANLEFLKKVSFVIIVEPSRLVTTAQVGLNLLIKCCGKDKKITYCSVDRNCDGLVDSLSHILMADITEVAATEYPTGVSSFMCWTEDGDYIQHRLVPGISRYLGMGTELSMVALKNQIKRAVWYGGETYPVADVHWIAKQYYHDLLKYAALPTTQETFDKCFVTSSNLCDEKDCEFSYVTVEDERNNLFETRRNFATIAQNQGFVNVISSEYMLREYMAENMQMFMADAKAVPYLTADYARTKRNAVLCICLRICIEGMSDSDLKRELLLAGIESETPDVDFWKELCNLFCGSENNETDSEGNPVISIAVSGKSHLLRFEKSDTLCKKRKYSEEKSIFENVYTIENEYFEEILLDDLKNAVYIAEQDGKDNFIGTELKGHVCQKYLSGQFFTLNGKYYEMVRVTAGNKILVRRASEHINGRETYRQVRSYTVTNLEDARSMGAIKIINNIDIFNQYADFVVETSGYWRMNAYNDFKNATYEEIKYVPNRQYHHKLLLKLDFTHFGDKFSASVRKTITILLNEVFVTLFAENAPFIAAVTPGDAKIPLTYSLNIDENVKNSENCIYIIEDSQLDLGLLITVERNLNRIFQIIGDYLDWNDEQLEKSRTEGNVTSAEKPEPFSIFDGEPEEAPSGKRKSIFRRKEKKPNSKKKKRKSAEKESDDSGTDPENDSKDDDANSLGIEEKTENEPEQGEPKSEVNSDDE